MSIEFVDGAQGDRRVVGQDRGSSSVKCSCSIGDAKRSTSGSRCAFNGGLVIDKVILPLSTCLFCDWELVPLVLCGWKTVFCQYGSCRNGRETFVRDRERCAGRLFMTVFKVINLFRHAWIFSTPIRHGLLEGHDVDVLSTPTILCKIIIEILGGTLL